eukprot:snap_masked-scaffold1424_size42081-processed-gene-0.5 protein:Tk00103 transcript:snap_masked-scaffold1424_size42081-processed-gene-0.5-mRNA-1 annotation:"dual specificity protein phosphatase 12-like"
MTSELTAASAAPISTINAFGASSASEDDESSTNTALFVQPRRNGRNPGGAQGGVLLRDGHIPDLQDQDEDQTIVIDLTEERQYVSRLSPNEDHETGRRSMDPDYARPEPVSRNGLFPRETSPLTTSPNVFGSLSDLGPQNDGGQFLISRMLNGRADELSPLDPILPTSFNEEENGFETVISKAGRGIIHDMGRKDERDNNASEVEGSWSPQLVHHEQEPLSEAYQRILSSTSSATKAVSSNSGPHRGPPPTQTETESYDQIQQHAQELYNIGQTRPKGMGGTPRRVSSKLTRLPELPTGAGGTPNGLAQKVLMSANVTPLPTPPSLDASSSHLHRPKELNTLKYHSRNINGDLVPMPAPSSALLTNNETRSSGSSGGGGNHLVLHNKGRSRSLKRDQPFSLLSAAGGSNDISSLDSPSLISTTTSSSRWPNMSNSSGRLRSGFVAALGRGGIDGSLDRRLASHVPHRSVVTRKSQSNDFLDRIDVSLGNSPSASDPRRRSRAKAKMNKIERNLYLGNMEAATDVILLESHGITHIVTLDSVPLPRKISSFLPKIRNLHIQVTDLPDEDILSFITQALAFINDGISSGGSVLVHCFRGKSRSATVVIAFLMQKYNLSLEQAFARVKVKRDCVNPHEGFLAQLKLYESMDYHLDPSNVQFKMFKQRLASERMRKAKILFRDSLDNVLDEDPGERGSAKGHYSQLYKCKKCRRTLATSHNVIPHVIGEAPDWADSKWSLPAEEVFEGASDLGLELCSQSVFINPIRWMQNEIKQNLSGRLYCPNCQAKVGHYTWIKGCACAGCKAVFTPAFELDVTEIIFKTKSRFLQSSGREPVVV